MPHDPFDCSLRVLLTGVFIALVAWLMVPAPVTHAMPLTDCSSEPICYGVGTWYGATNGDSTEIGVEFVTCGYCSGQISNETWLSDGSNTQCVLLGVHTSCWIEAGYGTYGPNSGDNQYNCVHNGRANCYFWADVRYNGGYHEHAVGNIPSGDYGGFELVEIYFNPGVHDNCGSNLRQGHWTISIYGPTNDNWTQSSTCNPMAAENPKDYITIGEELHNSGAESPSTILIDNFWMDGNFNWQGQFRDFDTREQDNPPYSGWVNNTPPSPGNPGEWNVCTQGCFGH